MQSIYLGMGCFWGYEKLFNELFEGLATEVGYVESKAFKEPVEVVKISVHKLIIPDLIRTFLDYHYAVDDPEFPVPDRYQSGIFSEDISNLSIAKNLCDQWERDNHKKIRTKIVNKFVFVRASEQHQKRYHRDSTICMPNSY